MGNKNQIGNKINLLFDFYYKPMAYCYTAKKQKFESQIFVFFLHLRERIRFF